jgi:thiamine-monophosphate kinase
LSGEFTIIEKYFAPLAADCLGALGLKDDAAILDAAQYVISKDILVEGVHFVTGDPARSVARKALRVNLSDIAAKGAKPAGYLLGCVWPESVDEEYIAEFAGGLKDDQDEFKICLMGGDTTVHRAKKAPLTISLTMFGVAGRSGMIKRSSAAIGDDVYVTGTIGDSGLGLSILARKEKGLKEFKDQLCERYQVPSPRVQIGGALCGIANSSIDISDGLIADAGHLAEESGVAIEIGVDRIPLSAGASAWASNFAGGSDSAIMKLAAFGDDYEILFTAPPSCRRAIQMAAQVTKTPVTKVGRVIRGAGVLMKNAEGATLSPECAGFDHFKR